MLRGGKSLVAEASTVRGVRGKVRWVDARAFVRVQPLSQSKREDGKAGKLGSESVWFLVTWAIDGEGSRSCEQRNQRDGQKADKQTGPASHGRRRLYIYRS